MINTKHGGKRKGAGRPVTGKHETTVIRVDTVLVPVISEIKAKYRETQSLDNLINVTLNQDSIGELETEVASLKGLRSDKELRKDNRELLLKIEKLVAGALVNQATIDKLITEKANNKSGRRPIKNPPTQYRAGTVIDVLAKFLPDGVDNTNDMRSALVDGYRKANGITKKLKADDASRINDYLKTLSVDEIKHLIKIKKDKIRDKAKAKRQQQKSRNH